MTMPNPTPPYGADITESPGRMNQAWTRYFNQLYAYINSLASSGGVPTGVVTTTASNLTAGGLIVGSGGDTVAVLPNGTTGQTIVFDGTGIVWASIAASGLPNASVAGAIPYYVSTGRLMSSGVLGQNELVLGGGPGGGPPSTPLGLGSNGQVLHANSSGAPTWGQVALTTDVTGILPAANGGATPNLLAAYQSMRAF